MGHQGKMLPNFGAIIAAIFWDSTCRDISNNINLRTAVYLRIVLTGHSLNLFLRCLGISMRVVMTKMLIKILKEPFWDFRYGIT